MPVFLNSGNSPAREMTVGIAARVMYQLHAQQRNHIHRLELSNANEEILVAGSLAT